jgi:hypothetical protein
MWATPTSYTRVGYNSRWSGSDLNRLAVTRPSETRSNTRFSYATKRKAWLQGSIRQTAARAHRDVSSRDETSEEEEEEEERTCGTSLLTHLPSGSATHLICWSTSLPTFHVGLNLAPTSCHCAVNNLVCMSLIRLKRIYNFWCSMLVLHHLLCVLFTLRGIFMYFLELTY